MAQYAARPRPLDPEATVPFGSRSGNYRDARHRSGRRRLKRRRDGMPLPNSCGMARDHHEAMPFTELPPFMRELRDVKTISARALEFTVLTAARTSEVLKATWDEIDLKAKVWSIPAQRMKGNRPHRVPLCDRVMRIINSLPRDGSDWLFPGSRPGRPLAADFLLKLLTRLRPSLTVHGLRLSSRLGWGSDSLPALCHRDGAGTRNQGQIRSRWIEGGCIREAAQADGSLGAILFCSCNEREGGGAPCVSFLRKKPLGGIRKRLMRL